MTTMTAAAHTPVAPHENAGTTTRERRRRRLALGLLASAQLVVMLDTSIVNVALPSIQADLALSPTDATWVVNAYILTFGGLLLVFGRLADVVGRRRMFVGGSALFTLGTLVAGCAPTAGFLVAGRIVQGAGAAALSPAAMSLLLLTFPGEARARAMSVWGAASAVGGATGVLAGGLLSGYLGWSSVFFVTVPISVAALVLARHVLDEGVRGARRRLDGRGALAITGAVVALVHGALGVGEGHLTSPAVLVSLGAAVALFVLFLAAERRAADPLVPLEMFRSRILSTGVGLALFGGAARASTFVLVALYLQQALHMAPQQAGMAMVPTSLTGFAVSLVLLPRVLRALGPRRALVLGLVILAGGHLWLAYAPFGGGYAVAVLPALFLVAVGVALSFTPTTMVIAGAVPETHSGLASGLAGSATQIGAALGTAGFTAIGLATGGHGAEVLAAGGFTAAFTAAAAVALVTAVLGTTISRSRP
ncbi:MFS transporter [Nocardioides pocheonensis]|uniref:MFS transporter n=1 Tax=Nocardioides pocheonensis TaxID=661485 RepID=A0A3N0GNP8_9ACTN|nr:MFS transporter [Nocardioides pocheonensis]RNM14057.1 MFS transporter [Nocardioides pocheonensis]